MKKTTINILLILILILLFGCSNNNGQVQDITNEEQAVNESESITNAEKTEDLSDVENAPFKATCLTQVKIRNDHSLDGNVIGYLDKGDVFEVLETYNDGEYIWNRIFEKCWFANNGEWIKRVPYTDSIENEIPDIIKFEVPVETHEVIRSESPRVISVVDTVHTFIDVDDYMCAGSSYIQKTSWTYLDNTFEDSSYEDTNSFDLASAYNPFINIQSGKTCSYEYDENGRISSITVNLTPDDEGNLTHWDFEYNVDGSIQRACLYSYDRSILMHEFVFQNDENGRIISVDENTWNDSIAVKVDRFYYTTKYEYNGNIIHIVQTRKGEPDIVFSKLIKMEKNNVKTVYYFVDRGSEDWTLSATDYKYN